MPDRFVLLMIASVILAFLIPHWGKPDGPLQLGLVTKIGIALIFLLHGANLAPEKLAAGLRSLHLHALIQGTTFVFFPLIGLVIYFALAPLLSDALRLGFFFLAALPSTVSSAVAMTALGRGNVPVAVFNATLSGLLGLILTPAMIAAITVAGMAQFSLIDASIDIAMTLLAPFIVGQLIRPLIKGFLERYKPVLSLFDRGIILLIVFTSFAGSTAQGIWSQFSVAELAITIGIVIGLLILAFGFTRLASRGLNLSREDEVAVVFGGGTKSLANGAPIANILFAGSPALGIILLPLMLYHQLQLMGCAIIAQRYSKQADREQATA